MALFGLITTKKEKAQAEAARVATERAEMMHAQTHLGHTLFAKLNRAASQNTIYNQYSDGRTARGVGPMRVERRETNGDLGYTVLVSIDDPSCSTFGGFQTLGYPLVQVSVNAERDNVHVFHCPYGPDRDFTLSEDFHEVSESIANMVRDYRLFR